MITVLLVVHLLVALALIGVVLLQRSEGGGLGIGGGGGGGGGMGGLMKARGAGHLLTRTTAILAAGFFLSSITLVILAGQQRAPRSIADQIVPAAPAAPISGGQSGGTTAPSAPAQPAAPSAPAR